MGPSEANRRSSTRGMNVRLHNKGIPRPAASIALKRYYEDPEHCKLRSQEQLTLHAEHPERFDSFETARRVRWEDSKQHENQSDLMIKRWENPEFVKMMLKSSGVKFNKQEKMLQEIFNDLRLPYRYVGDGQFTIGTKCPDFVNTNGQKKVIELLGCHWHGCLEHSPDEDKQKEFIDRVLLFKEFGYLTLGIWSHELKDQKTLRLKILEFDQVESLGG